MKYVIVAIALAFSVPAFARQYFQCSTLEAGYSDVMVVNLTTPEKGTLFISSGMENPESERTLVKIKLDKIENGQHYYKVIEGKGHVSVPSSVIGKSVNSVNLDLAFNGYRFTFSCFARIYND